MELGQTMLGPNVFRILIEPAQARNRKADAEEADVKVVAVAMVAEVIIILTLTMIRPCCLSTHQQPQQP